MVITRSDRTSFLMISGAADKAKMIRTQARFVLSLIHGTSELVAGAKGPSGTRQLFPSD